MPVLTLRGVEKSFHKRVLFSGVDLEVERGAAVGIQGENGSGKSVLLQIMTRFVRPDAGTVTIDPEYLSRDRVFPEEFGILINRPGYIPSQTGVQNLLSLAKIRGKAGEPEVRAAMHLVGLDPNLPQRAGHYSLGMKQRLGLAQAIMEDQQVLVLDEPFNAMDEETVLEMRELVGSFVADGKTLIMTSHNRDDIDALCTQTYRLRRERLERVT